MAHDVHGSTGIAAHSVDAEPAMRASDADRLATVMTLQDAMARGMLNPDEASERMAWAFAAVHRRDLDPLTADLASAPSRSDPPEWRTLARMTAERVRLSLADTTGRLGPAKVAVAFLVVLAMVLAFGSMTSEFLAHAAGPHMPGGFGHH
jgi:hypothetical protein